MMRGTAARAVRGFAHQIGLSILATLAATAIIGSIKSEWPPRVSPDSHLGARSLPSLTSGGKFAARALLDSDADASAPTEARPALPVFTAETLPRFDHGAREATALIDATLPATTAPAAEPKRTDDRAVRSVLAHNEHTGQKASPHTRDRDAASTGTIAMGALPDLSQGVVEDPPLWRHPEQVYSKVASWSDALVSRLLP